MTETEGPMQIFIALAALLGACGLALSAAAAHALPNAHLDVAGAMLLTHALAIVGAVAVAAHGLTARSLTLVACGLLAAGAMLFAGDIVVRATLGWRLFPMAAPTGGFAMLSGWVALAIAALAKARP